MSLSKAVLPGTEEEALAIGLQKSDPVHRLFDVLAEKLPQHKDVFEEIADSLEEEHRHHCRAGKTAREQAQRPDETPLSVGVLGVGDAVAVRIDGAEHL